jgi:hypothetical protein
VKRLLSTPKKGLQDDLERHREVCALRKKAKRLRAIARDVGDKHTVKQKGREMDAKATELTRKKI